MIRKLKIEDRQKIEDILRDTNNFNDVEISVAMELIDVYLKDNNQKIMKYLLMKNLMDLSMDMFV